MKRDKSLTVGLVLCFVVIIAIAGIVTFRKPEETPKNELAQTEEEEVYEEPTEITQGEDVEAEIVNPSSPVEPIVEVEQFYFADSDLIQWPISGNVLMNFSMDQTIYFATLEQYKYNPALLIEGKEGQEVKAVKEGKVTKVEETAETGITVTVNMGNGYEAIYGQLKDVEIAEGDSIKSGDVIGKLAKPSRYYSVEGCNLYFQLLKNGKPINPMDYLEP